MDNYYENKFAYYSRIVMMIILSIEFILNIAFLATFADINSQVQVLYLLEIDVFKFHKKCISAIFSLFFISFFVFIIELISYCGCCMTTNCAELCEIIFRKLNHLIMLLAFVICQFLYFIQCMIIPVFYDRMKSIEAFEDYDNIDDIDKMKNIRSKYSAMTAVSFIFLFLIIFLDFIIINLYKGICCQMEIICSNTQICLENFGRWFIDKISWICCIDKKDINSMDLRTVQNPKDTEIYELTGDIRNSLAENMKINIDKIINNQ